MFGIAVLASAYMLSQFYRSFLAVLTPDLTNDLGATNADLSFASGTWYIVFALMQFAVGVSLDRFGPRLTCAVLLAIGGGGGAILFAAATTPFMVTVAMGLIGIGCSPLLMGTLFIFAKSYPPVRFAMMASWFVGLGSVGNVLGAAPLANAVAAFGWRPTIFALGVVTLGIAALVLAVVRDPARTPADSAGSSGFGGYIELLRIPALWLVIPLVAVNYVPAAGIRGLWAGPYLADVHGADAITIGNVTLFMALAMVAGAFVYGPLDALLRTRKWVAVVGATLCLSFVMTLVFNPQLSLTAAGVTLFFIGLTGSSYGVLIAHGRTFFPPHLVGRGVTLMNFFSIGAVGLMQFLTGAAAVATHDPSNPAASYTVVFALYAGALAFGLLIYLFAADAKPERAASTP